MAKRITARFICRSCGAVSAKWAGQCESCGDWGSIVEDKEGAQPSASTLAPSKLGRKPAVLEFSDLQGQAEPPPRIEVGMAELDRVLGGGVVPSSVILVGGDPGIGKSTLLLQTSCALALKGRRVVYISGEESVDQIRLRARRLGLETAGLQLASSINVVDIVGTLEAQKGTALVVIDSIQTMWLETVDSAPGTVSQVRSSAFELIRQAKKKGYGLILVGHVTKEGALAGPRVLEHMVDAVLYFEGDRGHQFRILRAAKNRFGATDEIGVFAMTDRGLMEVSNPSALFLAERRGNISGSAVFAGLEGTRPVLLEVQALLSTRAGEGTPRRAVIGWDTARLNMLVAVLETRCGLKLGGADIYLNIAGGLKVSEPAADLAVAAALVSAVTGQPTNAGAVYFGEVGLSGEIRQVGQAEARLKEAAKLGFEEAFLPRSVARTHAPVSAPQGLALHTLGHLADLVALFSKG